MSCSSRYNVRRQVRKKGIIPNCKECEKQVISPRHKFCSSSCSAKYNNCRRPPASIEQKEKTSQTLKKIFTSSPEKYFQALETITVKGRKGRFRGILCESTWELAFVIWAIDNGKNIKRCRLLIPYELNNSTHYYNPDFEIDGKIYEIKGVTNEICLLKLKAAKDQNHKIVFIDRLGILKYLKYVKEKYKKNPEKEYKYFYQLA